jgi:septum formation protein
VKFILASGSASRKRVLEAVGVPFTALPADIDEDRLKDDLLAGGAELDAVAPALADAKALHVSRAQPDALVLGADQALLFENELVSKCVDLAAARLLLSRLRGKPHRLTSALALVQDGAVLWRHTAVSTLHMRDFSDAFLDMYLSTEGLGILGCVGCYKLEGLGAQLFESVEGDYFSILGLPLQPLLAGLRKQGVIAT